MDGVKFTGLNTLAEAKTALLAGLAAVAGNGLGSGAGPGTYIIAVGLCLVAGARASDKGHLLINGAGFHAHDTGDLLRYGSAADRTCCHRGFALRDRRGTAVTAGESAGAAVVAGQAFTDSRFLGIDLDLEFLSREYQESADGKSDDRKENNGHKCNNSTHIRTPPLTQT